MDPTNVINNQVSIHQAHLFRDGVCSNARNTPIHFTALHNLDPGHVIQLQQAHNESYEQNGISITHQPTNYSFVARQNIQILEPTFLNHVRNTITTKHGLTGRQELTFRYFIGRHDDHTLFQKDPIVMAVFGEGGTGKSRVIAAIQDYFTTTGRSSSIRTTAPTGCAAANIKGITIHSLLKLMQSRAQK